jgi:hypothetical protein
MTLGFRSFENASDYTFGCPDGEWTATLDHKAWGKTRNLILYFTEQETGAKYWLSVFHNDRYKAHDGSLDFKDEAEPGEVFILTTRRSKTGNPVLQSAKKEK